MTGDGQRLGTARITDSPAELWREIARAGKSPRVVLEAAYGWCWAADILEAADVEVHLAHPLGVKAFIYRRVKNDERDAADLADLLRMWMTGSAWLDQLGPPQPYAGKIMSLRQLTAELTTEIIMLSEVIADLLAGDRSYQVIQQLPGIGPVLAEVIIAEIGDVTRFASAARLCSWAGLTPRHRECPQREPRTWDGSGNQISASQPSSTRP